MKARTWLIRSIIGISLLVGLLAAPWGGAPAVQAQALTGADAGADADADAAADAAADADDEMWDNRFGLPGVQDSEAQLLAVAANGDVFVAGRFNEIGNIAASQVARWDGRQFHPLGEGLSGGSPRAIVTDGNDLYAVGNFTSAGAESVHGIARWDGAAWSAVGGEGPKDKHGSFDGVWLRAAAIHDGKLVIAGQFRSIDGVPVYNIAAWDGAAWSPLGGGLHGPADWSIADVHSLVSTGATLYAGGEFEMADGVWKPPADEWSDPELDHATTVNSVAAWNGAAWSPLGAGVQFSDGSAQLGEVTTLAYGNSTLYAGGYFNRAGGKAVNYVAQWDGSGWNALGSGLKLRDFSTDSPVNSLLYANGLLYAGGDFSAAGGKTVDLLAAWDGAAWGEVAGGINNEGFDKVYALASAPAGLIVGGYFRVIGDMMVNNIALLSGGEWSALGQGVSTDFGDMPGKPFALASDAAGNIFIGGDFTRLGGVRAKNIGYWDGAAWHALGDADSYVSALALGEGFLYAGGNFTQIGGVAASHVARMDLQTGQWSALGSGINGPVNALAYSDGVLYAGGAFKAAGTVTAEDVAYWDGAAWHPFGTKYRIFEVGDKGGEVGTFVNALAVSGDDVYIGGHFQTIQFGTNTTDLSSFVVVHNVVQWNRAADQWGWVGSPAKPGVTTDGFSGFGTDVYALALSGNSLFIGGDFNKAGDLAATGLARWDRAASQYVSIDGSLGGAGFDDVHVRSLAPSGADLLVAGKFTSAGAAPARYIARFDTTTNQWSALGSGLRWYNDRFTKANVVLATPGGVYTGGDFDQAGQKGSLGFARWTGALNAPNLTPEQGGNAAADGALLTFPAGAVDEAAVATLTRSAEPAARLPNTHAALYGLLPAVTTVSGRQLGQTSQPFTVQATYSDAELAAKGITDPATLQLFAWDGGAWQPLAAAHDAANKRITATTSELRPLALAGQKAGGQGEDPGNNQSKLYLPAIAK